MAWISELILLSLPIIAKFSFISVPTNALYFGPSNKSSQKKFFEIFFHSYLPIVLDFVWRENTKMISPLWVWTYLQLCQRILSEKNEKKIVLISFFWGCNKNNDKQKIMILLFAFLFQILLDPLHSMIFAKKWKEILTVSVFWVSLIFKNSIHLLFSYTSPSSSELKFSTEQYPGLQKKYLRCKLFFFLNVSFSILTLIYL